MWDYKDSSGVMLPMQWVGLVLECKGSVRDKVMGVGLAWNKTMNMVIVLVFEESLD